MTSEEASRELAIEKLWLAEQLRDEVAPQSWIDRAEKGAAYFAEQAGTTVQALRTELRASSGG